MSKQSVVPAGGLKKMISDEHGVDLTYIERELRHG